jgi:group I intron endonuclease
MVEALTEIGGCLSPPSDIGIYLILSPSGKVYIGQSSQLKRRRYEHCRLLKKGEHTNKFLQNVFNKYQEDMLYFVIEYLDDVGSLTEREQYWMDIFQSATRGMNLAPAAGSSLGCVRTAEQRKVISDITTVFWGKEENRKAQSDRKIKFFEENPEHLLKMSEITKRTRTERPELLENHSALMKERSNTKEALEAFSTRMIAWNSTQTSEERSERSRKAHATKALMSENYWETMRLRTCLTKAINMKGDRGIEWHKSETRQGTPRLDACARWQEVDGNQKLKRFSVAKYGLIPAHFLACCFRDAVRERLISEYMEVMK